MNFRPIQKQQHLSSNFIIEIKFLQKVFMWVNTRQVYRTVYYQVNYKNHEQLKYLLFAILEDHIKWIFNDMNQIIADHDSYT